MQDKKKIKGIPSPQDQKIAIASAMYSGPIPHPKALADYEAIQSGFAERIIKMAENQAKHRQDLETKALNSQVESVRFEAKEISKGQWFAFLIATFTVGAGASIIWQAMETNNVIAGIISGTIFAGAGLSGIVYTFINGRNGSNKPPCPPNQ